MSISQNSFSTLLSWFFSKKSNYVFEKEPWNQSMFSRLLCEMYDSLKKNCTDHNCLLKTQISKKFDENRYQTKFLSPVNDIRLILRELDNRNLLEDVILHGSLSSLDYVKGWSDADISIILSERAFRDELCLIETRNKILSCTNYLYLIDPLQHHEFLISADITQNYAKNPSLPTVVLASGKSLLGRKHIHHVKDQVTINAAKQRFNNIAKLFKRSSEVGRMDHHAIDGICLEEDFKNIETMYQLKYFLALVMTLPAYFLDACGNPIYKKYSFDVVESIPGIDFELLNKASQIRIDWGAKMIHPFIGNSIPTWVIDTLGPNYFARANSLCEVLKEHIK